MSYDVSLEMDTGGPEPARIELTEWVDPPATVTGPTGNVTLGDGFIGNYTSNVSPIWARALKEVGGPLTCLADASGRNAGECVEQLRKAGLFIAANPDTFEPMDPPNGWGDHLGAAGYLLSIAHGCEQHPKASIYVGR